MTAQGTRHDLVVLTADKDAQFAIRGILTRGGSLGIRPVTLDYFVHPEHDPGVYGQAHDFLRPFLHTHSHALVVMDREGSGQELSREEMEAQLEAELKKAGWANRARAIVIDPELEAWIWSDSPHVDTAPGWKKHRPALRDWLRHKNWLTETGRKPIRPKEAVEAALREVKVPRSSAIYEVSFSRCTDPAFGKLKTVLGEWFGKKLKRTTL